MKITLLIVMIFVIGLTTDTMAEFERTTLDSTGNVGQYTSIAIDSNNKVHVSYYDAAKGTLKYATNISGAWVYSTLDSSGEYTSIAIDSNNKVHISYYDAKGTLKYATNISGAWVYSTLDSSGGYTSIAIDSNNKVHISYYNAAKGTLKYATNISGAWVYSTVDESTSGVGYYTSIAIDSNNKVHISYYDIAKGTLKYATNVSGTWVYSTVDESTSGVGYYTSIAIDSNNKVHVSYYDAAKGTLKYATNISGTWVYSTLDNVGVVTWSRPYWGTSIVIDSNNKVHISYYNAIGQTLKYASDSSGLWIYSTVDIDKVGTYTSIAIDSNNKVHISYYDGINGDLKYAFTYVAKQITYGELIVSPNPFTPNGDGANDYVGFYFNNPNNEEVSIRIFNKEGRLIRTITGTNPIWDGKDESGDIAESGVYIYQFKIGDERRSGIIILAK